MSFQDEAQLVFFNFRLFALTISPQTGREKSAGLWTSKLLSILGLFSFLVILPTLSPPFSGIPSTLLELF